MLTHLVLTLLLSAGLIVQSRAQCLERCSGSFIRTSRECPFRLGCTLQRCTRRNGLFGFTCTSRPRIPVNRFFCPNRCQKRHFSRLDCVAPSARFCILAPCRFWNPLNRRWGFGRRCAPRRAVVGGFLGDPHIKTFDGLEFDCQASGHFTLMKVPSLGAELQALFQGPNTKGSVNKGMVVEAAGFARVQVSIVNLAASPSENFRGCPLSLFVDGVYRDISSGTGLVNVTLGVDDNLIAINFENDLVVSFDVRSSTTFGCYLDGIRVFLPENANQANDVTGLLGRPNGDLSDEWHTRAGLSLPLPTTDEERLFESAYNYCTTNWCVRSESESMFAYEAGQSFATFDQCDVAFGGETDLSGASEQLQELCGTDASCLVDGLVGDVEDAQNALTRQIENDELDVSSSPLRIRPVGVTAGVTTAAKISVDFSSRKRSEFKWISRYDVFKYDVASGNKMGEAFVSLFDDGSSITKDDNVDDLIYSNEVGVLLQNAGATESFIAVPVNQKGRLRERETFMATGSNILRGYSAASNLTMGEEEAKTVTVRMFEEMELAVVFKWRNDGPILRHGLQLDEEAIVGADCENDSAVYVNSTTSTKGSQEMVVDLGAMLVDGVWNSTDVSVDLFADWEDDSGSVAFGASVRVVMRNATSGEEIEESSVGKLIVPGNADGCASTRVGSLKVAKRTDVSATVTVE